jgi:serine/threonine protein kinase
MPRQQVINFKYAKPDVDVWAMAATYYVMLTGHAPRDFFVGMDPIAVILSKGAVPIRSRLSTIPEKLAKVIDKALHDNPTIGIQTAKELKELIVQAM